MSVLPVTRVAYVDRTGSGCETLAHVYDNGRACIMFCSFGTTPRIMRLYCTLERVLERGDRGFEELVLEVQRARSKNWFLGESDKVSGDQKNFVEQEARAFPIPFPREEYADKVPPASRAVIVFRVFKVQTSCGYGVPQIKSEMYTNGNGNTFSTPDGITAMVMDKIDPLIPWGTTDLKPTELSCFLHRPTLTKYSEKLEKDDRVESYQIETCLRSLDGLPGMKNARLASGENVIINDIRWKLTRLARTQVIGVLIGLLVSSMALLLGWLMGVVSFSAHDFGNGYRSLRTTRTMLRA